jgi:methylenetetrahydrofolate reductase (NADPH)
MTKIKDLLAAGPTLSFEFSPPKTDEAERALDKTVAELADLDPSFMSMTYGAMGSTRDRTRDAVLRLNRDHPFPTMAHLTCVAHTRDDIHNLLAEYADGDVDNILALGGDPPADGSDPGGDFEHALELVQLVRERYDFSIGVAAHPEIHPRSPSRESDRQHLAEKLDVADFGITQFFFTAEPYLRMVDELAARGCDKPVLPGLVLFLGVGGLVRMSAMNNAAIPPTLLEAAERADGDALETRKVAVDAATALGAELLEAGVPGVHIYALGNRSEAATELVRNLGIRP